MTNTITFFDKYQDLCKLTGAQSHKELWDAGFDLDDWDFGFVSNKPWNEINGRTIRCGYCCAWKITALGMNTLSLEVDTIIWPIIHKR